MHESACGLLVHTNLYVTIKRNEISFFGFGTNECIIHLEIDNKISQTGTVNTGFLILTSPNAIGKSRYWILSIVLLGRRFLERISRSCSQSRLALAALAGRSRGIKKIYLSTNTDICIIVLCFSLSLRRRYTHFAASPYWCTFTRS